MNTFQRLILLIVLMMGLSACGGNGGQSPSVVTATAEAPSVAVSFGEARINEAGNNASFTYQITTTQRGLGSNDYFLMDVRIKDDVNTPWAHEPKNSLSGTVAWDLLPEKTILQVRIGWYEGSSGLLITQSQWQDVELPAKD